MTLMDEDLSEKVRKCLKILEENIDILSNLESALDDEKENDLVADLDLHDLYDMTEDVVEAIKIKRAEGNFMRRKADDF